MIDVYLCDDEELQLSHLAKIIDTYLQATQKNAHLVSAQQNPEKLLEDLNGREQNPSLFFIDVQLNTPSMDGFMLGQKLKQLAPLCHLVFLTCKGELAWQTFEFELEVLDYIVKRTEFFLSDTVTDSLAKRLDHIFEKIETHLTYNKVDAKLIQIECGSKLIDLDAASILFIQTVKGRHQTEIFSSRQRIITRHPLNTLYDMLSPDFAYINKSCIVRLDKIIEVDRKSRFLTLGGGHRLEISYREIKNVFNRLSQN
ncbi:hypothetical protein C818_03839 [Lachnospiraceae bacterium MD308]|nr:hypothetical protein C818_03839 [Lachnospiraceae bacterium MD308]MCI8503450.1 response regulator transcription factor [Dorea sp.]